MASVFSGHGVLLLTNNNNNHIGYGMSDV